MLVQVTVSKYTEVTASGRKYYAKAGATFYVNQEDAHLFGDDFDVLSDRERELLNDNFLHTLSDVQNHPDLTQIEGIGSVTADSILVKLHASTD